MVVWLILKDGYQASSFNITPNGGNMKRADIEMQIYQLKIQ